MFETLFTCPGALRRHRDGPLAVDRAAYLSKLAAQGMARGTILRRSSYCLCVAVELQRWPSDRCFDEDDVEQLAVEWAAQRSACGGASSPRWPKEHFRLAATDFLRSIGRLCFAPPAKPGRYDSELCAFIAAQQEGRWLSAATCQSARWQVTQFLDYVEQRGVSLSDVAATDVDAFFEHMAQRWSRSSLHTSARKLRAWFRYCETRGQVPPKRNTLISRGFVGTSPLAVLPSAVTEASCQRTSGSMGIRQVSWGSPFSVVQPDPGLCRLISAQTPGHKA